MKKIFTRIVAALTVLTLMLCAVPMNSSAAGEMAYNMYTSPDISKTSGVHTTYMIDFRAPQSVYGTYWALANFGMDINKDTLKKYKKLSGGGGYAGMQHYKDARYTETERVAILSFWHWTYYNSETKTNEALEAHRVYPYGPEVHFSGEGTGTKSIQDYPWQPNQWYTMVLHTWEDVENNTTFAGEWILDQSTGEWTLVTYYDTKLINSGWTGNMGLFMENFLSSRREGTREYNVKGMYVLDKETKKWTSVNRVTLSYGNGGTANKVGTHEYGFNEEEGYFWGITDGTMREDQAEHDAAWPESQSKTYTVEQPKDPTFGTLSTAELKTEKNGNDLVVNWTAAEKSTPHVGFKVEIIDESGKVVATQENTRPELTTLTIKDVALEEYNCRLTVTDIFGQTTVTEKATDGYALKGEEPSPSEDDESEAEPSAPAEPSASVDAPTTSDKGGNDDQDGENKSIVPVIVAIVCVVAVAVIAVGVVLIVKKKKK